jgi:acetyl-CoA carboxylase carboxyl transferase subunit beta
MAQSNGPTNPAASGDNMPPAPPSASPAPAVKPAPSAGAANPANPPTPPDMPASAKSQSVWGAPKDKAGVPAGLWIRCPECEKMLYRKNVEQNLNVCPECDSHFRIGAVDRANQLCDPGSFEPMWEDLAPRDVLQFVDLKAYPSRLEAEKKKSKRSEAIICGKGFIKGRGVMLACLDNQFLMGTMGAVVGEKVTLTIEAAIKHELPLIIVSCSGGARMMEGMISLMQMSKTSAALAKLDDAGGLFISVLTDPTTGGVTASFAMLGDVILAEPKALICFAGPRVIANTVRQVLPEGFQRAEHLLAKGFVDRIVHRKDLRSEIGRIIDYAGK